MKEYLPAIDKLIEYYESFKWWRVPQDIGAKKCPLCNVSKLWSLSECDSCPWVKIDGHFCYRLQYSKDRTYKRIRRLKRWRKQIAKPDTVRIEHEGLIATVYAENHAGYWEILKARLFGKKVETAESTVIKYRGKYYLTDYRG